MTTLFNCASCGKKDPGEHHQLLKEQEEKKPPPASHGHEGCDSHLILGILMMLLLAGAIAALVFFLHTDAEEAVLDTTGCTADQVPCTVEDGVANITLNGHKGWTRSEINALGCYVCAVDADTKDAQLEAMDDPAACTTYGVGKLLPCNTSIADPLTYLVCFLEDQQEIEYKTLDNKVCTGESDVVITVADPSQDASQGLGEWGVTVVEDDKN